MDESQNSFAKKPDKREYIVYHSNCIPCITHTSDRNGCLGMGPARGWGGRVTEVDRDHLGVVVAHVHFLRHGDGFKSGWIHVLKLLKDILNMCNFLCANCSDSYFIH